MVEDLILRVKTDASEVLAAMAVVHRHAEQSPDVLECFDARFPTLSDMVEIVDSESKSDGLDLRVTLRPSEAFRSFIQDLK